MTAHVLLIALGPVQDFIAQARRTRDLWYGSHLLSELGRAAARALVDAGAQLVFPALAAGAAELAPCPSPLREREDRPPLNIANRLLAEVPDGVDPERVARAARSAVMQHWRGIAAVVKDTCAELLADHIDASWDEQIATFIEFAAAWAPAPAGEYAAARRSLDRTLAARKHLRDFAPWRCLRGDVPKSSLDGARETVLRKPNNAGTALPKSGDGATGPRKPSDGAARLARKYGISRGEQLDAVGLVKRAGGDPEQFVPVVNVALACWIALAAQGAPGRLARLRDGCDAVGLKRVRRDLPCASVFPFDGSVLLQSRWQVVFEESGLQDAAGWGKQYVRPLLEVLCDPYPYVACLVADGDHMGRAIERIGSADAHRSFSRCLAGFASDARRIIEQDHCGSLVYAGGDDVLAFLPLPEALACAGALRRRFQDTMGVACPELAEMERPTLSIGLGVGHVMESMGELLALGREAEQLAKGAGFAAAKLDRDALGVVVDKRSGGRRAWRSRWEHDPIRRLQRDAELLAQQLSTRKVYEIARTLARLPDPARANDPAWARLLALEVERSLSRANAGERGVELDALGLSLDASGYAALHAEVSGWIDRLLVARAFGEAAPRLRRGLAEAAA